LLISRPDDSGFIVFDLLLPPFAQPSGYEWLGFACKFGRMFLRLERFTLFRPDPVCLDSSLVGCYFSIRSLIDGFDALSPFMSDGTGGRVWTFSDPASPATRFPSCLFDEIPEPLQVFFDLARRDTQ
jgi:hypothetical protein